MDLVRRALAGIGERGEEDDAVGHDGFEGVVLNDGRFRRFEFWLELAQDDFLERVFEKAGFFIVRDNELDVFAELFVLRG